MLGYFYFFIYFLKSEKLRKTVIKFYNFKMFKTVFKSTFSKYPLIYSYTQSKLLSLEKELKFLLAK